MTATPPGNSDGTGGVPLSPRQHEILRLAALGLTQGQIAARLGVGLQTVKNHLTVAYRKTHAGNLVDALRAVGWLRVPES